MHVCVGGFNYNDRPGHVNLRNESSLIISPQYSPNKPTANLFVYFPSRVLRIIHLTWPKESDHTHSYGHLISTHLTLPAWGSSRNTTTTMAKGNTREAKTIKW